MTKRNFTDLTAIDCPFGELDDDTQARLKAWPHGWQMNTDHRGWIAYRDPAWNVACTYRAIPSPVKEVGTLAEIGAQVGDTVQSESGWVHTVNQEEIDIFTGDTYRIIRRASDAKPAPAGPVVIETVQRQRIIHGIYGKLSVHHIEADEDGRRYFALVDSVSHKEQTVHALMNAAELRALAVAAIELADAMIGGAK